MKTKLDLYLAVQAAAEKSLDLKEPKQIDAALAAVFAPLKTPLAPDDRAQFSQIYYSRRQRMLELRAQPLDPAPTPVPAA